MGEDGRTSSLQTNRNNSLAEKSEGCSFAKVKSCVKVFCAHLFSHVGLSALVMAYTFMGAFVFSYLEQGNEIETRVKVGSNRKDTLEQLYNITGSIRLKLLEQSIQIDELTRSIKQLTEQRNQCRQLRRKEGRFLQSVITQCKGDNVPLTEAECREYCTKTLLKPSTCKKFCDTKAPPCTYWHSDTHRDPKISFEELMKKVHQNKKGKTSEKDQKLVTQTLAKPSENKSRDDGAEEVKSRQTRSVIPGTGDLTRGFASNLIGTSDVYSSHGTESSTFQTMVEIPDQDHPQSTEFRIPTIDPQVFRTPAAEYTTEEITLADYENPPEETITSKKISDKKGLKINIEDRNDLPDQDVSSSPVTLMSVDNEEESSTSQVSIHDKSSEEQNYLVGKAVVQPPPKSYCVNIACLDHTDVPEVHCLDLSWTNTVGNKYRPLKKHFNILWKANWTREAEKVLKIFERDVIMKVKSEGYDGNDNEELNSPSQWNFSGALLYSVTIITTIGYGNIAPKTKWGRIVTMIYATFGMPIFLMWVSNMGTLLAQTFTFLYSHVCCFVCKQGKKRKLIKKQVRKEERESRRERRAENQQREERESRKEKEGRGGLELGRSKQEPIDIDLESAVNSTIQKTRDKEGLDPLVKQMLTECARYNLDNNDDDPLSEAVVEEIRHADAMDIIRERSLNASPLISPVDTPHRSPAPPSRCYRELTGADKNRTCTPDGERQLIPTPDPRTPGLYSVSSLKHDGSVNTTLLRPPANHLPIQISGSWAPRASQEESPTSSKVFLTSEREEEVTKGHNSSRGPPPDSPAPIEKVPVMPVIVFIVGYILLGAGIFSAWENWSFLEGAYFSFITLTTIGFGDFVPGDAVLNAATQDGQYKLILACLYVLVGLAVISMTINLLQEEVIDMVVNLAKDLGIIDDDDDEDDD